MNNIFIRSKSIILILIVLICLILFPYFVTGYWVRVVSSMFMYISLTQALNIISGYTGYAALGNVAFFGLGAYMTAIGMVKWNWPFYPSLLLGGLFCFFCALIFGYPLLKLKGHYFVMGSFGLMFLAREIIINLDYTLGSRGIALPILNLPVVELYRYYYFVLLIIATFTVLTVWFIDRSRFGFGLRAIKSDEEAAATMGVMTVRYKMAAWGLSAFITALVGGTYAYWATYIDPSGVFSIVIAVKTFVMLLLGGAGTVFGPVIGASLIELIGELVWGKFPNFHLGVLGLIMIIVTLALPEGLIKLFDRDYTQTIISSRLRELRNHFAKREERSN